MTDAQKAAYIHAQSIAASIECVAMQAANTERVTCGESPAYGEDEFMQLIAHYDLKRDALMEIIEDLESPDATHPEEKPPEDCATPWFFMLERARIDGDLDRALKANHELERLRISVRFGRSPKTDT